MDQDSCEEDGVMALMLRQPLQGVSRLAVLLDRILSCVVCHQMALVRVSGACIWCVCLVRVSGACVQRMHACMLVFIL